MPHNLLDLLLGRAITPRPPQDPNMPTEGPSLVEIGKRQSERAGLPGHAPVIDPRWVNPANNPLESHEGLQRGDIQLPGKFSQLMEKAGVPNPNAHAVESPDRSKAYLDTLSKLGYK